MVSSRDSIFKAIEAEAKPKRIFVIKNGEGKFILVRDPDMTQVERKLRSTRMPMLLQENHLTTKRQLEEDDLVELVPNILYEVEFPSELGVPGEVGSVIKLTMERLQELGLLKEYLEVRAELLHKDKLPLLAKISQEEDSSYKKLVGTVYQTSLTRNPKSDPGSLHLSSLQRRQDEWNGKSINERLMKLVSKATRMVIPNIRGGGREERWHAVASMTPYWDDNHETSSIQLNYTPQATSVNDALKKFAVGHTDSGDDPTGYSGLCGMSHFDESHFAGRFNLTPLGMTTTVGKCELLLFPAKLWLHCSSGSGTYDVSPNDPRRLQPSPLDHLTKLPADTPFMRLNAVVFPNRRCLNPTWRQIHGELWTEKGRSIYPSTAAHQEWMMRIWIANEAEITHWLEKLAAEEECPDAGKDTVAFRISFFRDHEACGPALLSKATEFMTKAFRSQLEQWKAGNNLRAKASDEQAEKDARDAGLDCEDAEVKAQRIKKEKAANSKARMAYSAQSHIFPPVERALANDYRRLFAWLDENTGKLRYPSEECTTKTLEWCDKPNDEFKNLLKKAEYLDCGSRVSNAGGAGGAGSLIIPKVTWFNPDFHKEFDPLTDTIPGNPSWQPGALGGEEADHKDSNETRKWSHEQAVWEQGGNGVFRDVEYTGVDDYWSAAGVDEESNQIVQSGEGSMISQAQHFAEYEPWLQEDYD
ncbi:hypothetical protein DL95DRAFT_505135 [Leptodontidium sp. 2 PMI_412]|nr:hypothetical protein DL95DRAFT_505135 [Leptodontidium sp. 2 PMI_412]